MKLLLVGFLAVCAVMLLACGVILIVRKGKPFKQNKIIYKTEEEKILGDKTAFHMGIILLFQAVALFFMAAAIYLQLLILYLTALVFMIPVMIWAVKTLRKKKKADTKSENE